MRRKPTTRLLRRKPSRRLPAAKPEASAEERFRKFLQDVDVGVVLLGPRAEFQFSNQPALAILGMTLDQVLGKTSQELNLTILQEDGSDYPFSMRPGPRSIASGEPVRNHVMGLRRPGSDEVFWIYGSAVPQFESDGSLRQVVCTFIDITTWKQAENRLRESEERFRGAFDFAAIGMAIVGIDGQWLRVNKSLCRIVGYSEDELLARDFQSITHPEDLKPDLDLVRQLVEGAIPNYHMEKRYIHKDGHEVCVLLSVSLVRDQRGDPLYFVSQIQDITARKRAEEELRQLSSQLLKLQDEERRRIARDLHDSFSQNLVGISLNLARLAKSAKMRGGREQRVLTETRRMVKGLARETRTFSYLLHPPVLDELGLVSAIEEYGRGYSARSGIKLELDLPSSMGRLPMEIETALFRVTQESMGNIQKHSGSTTGRIRLWKTDHEIMLEVTDEGRGMVDKHLRDGGVGALGVGILGMRERMRQLGGRLEVVSGNPGTVVRATLALPH